MIAQGHVLEWNTNFDGFRDRSIDWLVGWMFDWLIDWLIDKSSLVMAWCHTGVTPSTKPMMTQCPVYTVLCYRRLNRSVHGSMLSICETNFCYYRREQLQKVSWYLLIRIILAFSQYWQWPRAIRGNQSYALRWRHNDHAGVSNHQPHGCLLNRLFRRNSKKTSKLRVTGLCAGNSPGTGEFPAQMASYAENVSIWWRHHETLFTKITVIDTLLYPIAQRSCWGYIGFTPSVHPSVRSAGIPCPLCSACSSGWIHFIFIHLIKHLQKLCRV